MRQANWEVNVIERERAGETLEPHSPSAQGALGGRRCVASLESTASCPADTRAQSQGTSSPEAKQAIIPPEIRYTTSTPETAEVAKQLL